MKTKVLYIAGAGLLALDVTDAKADTYKCETSTMSTVLTPPSVTIPRNLPVGSLIGSELVSGTVKPFQCSNTSLVIPNFQEFGVKAYGTYVTIIHGRRVYSTNVPGVGYAVGATTLNVCEGTTLYVDGATTADGNVNNKIICSKNGVIDSTAQARILFYKTAQSTGTGTVSARQVGSFVLRNNFKDWTYPESVISTAAFNVKSLACTVSSTVISVPMGKVEKRAFSGPGSWPGDANTRSFYIPLNCNAGTKVRVQIDGSAWNAAQGVLNLNGGTDSASGVGIQLLQNNVPLPLATQINTGTTVSEGAYNIPLQARYYQISSSVTPGTANASATFTLTYP